MKNFLFFSLLIICLNLNAQVCFYSAGNYAVDDLPSSITSADFNGDGISDIAAANSTSDNVSILLGIGNGNFNPTNNFSTGDYPYAIANADFNGDGNIDLVTTNFLSNNVSVLLGTGNGSFGSPTHFSVGVAALSVTCSDFNEDGKVDLAIACDYVSILLGTGTGSFGAENIIIAGNHPYSVISSDFNEDGNIDLAVANGVSANVSIFLGTGLGTFSTANNFPAGLDPRSVTSNDFNEDGFLDLALTNYGNSQISILLGTGTGSFGSVNNFNSGINPCSVTNADFNGDGNIDLAVSNSNSDNVSILLGTGTGSFNIPIYYSVVSNPRFIITDDFNGDGRSDLATANSYSNNVSVLLNSDIPLVSAGVDQIVCSGSTISLSATITGGSSPYSYSWSNGVQQGIPFQINSSNTYSVTVMDNYGCSSVDEVNIGVMNTPIANAGPDKYICLGDDVTLNATSGDTYVWDNGVVQNIAFYPTVTTSYTVTVSNTNGCYDVDTVIVYVGQIPLIDAGINLSSCIGSSITLLGIANGGTPPYAYSWSNGVQQNVPFIVLNADTYTVTVTDDYGCTSTDSLNIDTLNTPVANAGLDQNICHGDGVILTAIGGDYYDWSGGVAQNILFYPTITTTYTVTVSSNNGCSDIDTVLIYVDQEPVVYSGNDQSVCTGTPNIYLNGSVNNASSFIWYGGAGTYYPNETTLNITYNPTTSEISNGFVNLLLSASGTGNCAGFVVTDTILITFLDNPIADAGSEWDTVCGYSYALNPVPPTSGTGFWTSEVVTGDVWFESTNSWTSTTMNDTVSTNVLNTGGANPYYNIIWTVQDSICSDSDTIRLVYVPIPTGEFAIRHPYCIGEEGILTANTTGNNVNIINFAWDLSGGLIDSTQTDLSDMNPVFVYWENAIGDEQHTVTLISENGWGCFSDTSDGFVNEPPSFNPTFYITEPTNGDNNGVITFCTNIGEYSFAWMVDTNWFQTIPDSIFVTNAQDSIYIYHIVGDTSYCFVVQGESNGYSTPPIGTFCIEGFCIYVNDASYINNHSNENLNFMTFTPNPFMDQLRINYTLKRESYVKLEAIDGRGVILNTLNDSEMEAGLYMQELKNLKSGIYYIKLTVDNVIYINKVICVANKY